MTNKPTNLWPAIYYNNAMLHVQTFTFNAFQENTCVLYDDQGDSVVIDPGCYEKHEKETLKEFIDSKNLKVHLLLNTHCHVDHVFGNKFIKDTYQVPLLVHGQDLPTLKAAEVLAPAYGFNEYETSEPDQLIEAGQTISFGANNLEVRFVPGHAPGHVVFYNVAHSFVINGDVLFRGSVGRTDLPGGNHNTLLHNIHTQMFTLPDDTKVYCGHGPETTIGFEKANNPFVKTT